MNIKYMPSKTGETEIHENGDVEYITFPALNKYPEIYAAFSTRKGGISTGMFSSMNLGRTEMDSPENVRRNFELFCDATGIDSRNIVISDQQHTDNIKFVTEEDRGKGIYVKRDYEAIDGFITDRKNVALCLLFADCVPVYLYDRVKNVIGLVHSGWKGTKAHISAKAVRMMHENFGSRSEDITAVIAPSICRDCYEVSEDLLEAFSETFPEKELSEIFRPEAGVPGKYMLDLWRANRIVLENAGVAADDIHTTDICTCCNSEFLFSHRASKGKRGNLAAILMLR